MTTHSTSPAAESPNNRTRNLRLLILLAVVILGVSVYSAYFFFHARYFESTDDAYVAADMVQITTEIGGTVSAVYVDDTQHVKQGQVLLQLDPADAEIALQAAEAELARTVRSVRGLYSRSKGLEASIRANQVSLKSAQEDLERRQMAARDGGVSSEELQHAQDQVAQLDATLIATKEELETTNAQIDNTSVTNHPQVRAAAAQVRQAALSLKRTEVRAPISGVVARRNVQIGSRIAAGSPLMAVVSLDDVWVDANFKEVQIKNMRVGQPVAIHADIYGNDVEYPGKIVGLGAGSGSAFALLPPQNASGNWIKIVQRVPVRIALDQQTLKAHPLRVGLSMHATVDLHDVSGSIVATEVREHAQLLPMSAEHDDAVEEKIANIIAQNSGDTTTTLTAN
ncbi:Multidrug export protein EmrA [Thalassocella blandensis]|nr:Multidrug export protein EmrA [Thalassocella blandensis]